MNRVDEICRGWTLAGKATYSTYRYDTLPQGTVFIPYTAHSTQQAFGGRFLWGYSGRLGVAAPMPYELLGLGGTSYVTTTDHKTVLKGHQVWRDGERYLSRDDCEDDLAREAVIYAHLGDHRTY